MSSAHPLIILVIFILTLIALAQEGTKNPHGDLMNDCLDCHTQKSWSALRKPLLFNHEKTGFPLIGTHQVAQCRGCHHNLIFSQVASACADCHTDIHKGTFGLQCQSCHDHLDWKSQKDLLDVHLQKGFALTGAHQAADCRSCHPNQIQSEFAGVSDDCYSCHRADYLATANPNHPSSGFPTNCQGCHSTTIWGDASWNHDLFFPIYSGAHRGKWNSCSDCHVSPGNFQVFECINCHAHDQASMDSHHQEVKNYVYSSQACYNCHPDGRHE